MLGSGLKTELTVLEKIVIVCERSREDKSNGERVIACQKEKVRERGQEKRVTEKRGEEG